MKKTVTCPSDLPVTRAEIDLKALGHNYDELKRCASGAPDMMVAVKGDGYGHGAVEVSKTALAHGARFLAVARFNEACRLREAGIDAPILIFGHTMTAHIGYAAENNISISINSMEAAAAVSQEALSLKKTIRVHVKIDTGMGRLGLPADGLSMQTDENGKSTAEKVIAVAGMPGIELEGVFTHFACADHEDKSSANKQVAIFKELLGEIEKNGLHIPFRHAANSAATIEIPEAHFDMVRPGISLYGLWPSGEVNKSLIDLRPVMSVKSHIIQVKKTGPDFAVSYGSTHITSGPATIATVPIGYADGYHRILSNKGSMLVHGQRAPIIGRVCMDLTMIDVTHIPNVKLEDEVVILGPQGNEEITADEIAELAGTINYEIVSSFTSRVTRVYIP